MNPKSKSQIIHGDNPYVGPNTFSSDQAHLFFGRNREAGELLSLVASRRLVVFYAESGAGKSSLINARLIPDLKTKHEFEVLPVGRVSGAATEETVVDNIFIYNLMLSLEEGAAKPEGLARLSLAEFLLSLEQVENKYTYQPDDAADGAAQTSEDGDHAPAAEEAEADYELLKRALIIDQFEEIFTTHPEEWQKRGDFFQQLHDAMQADPFLWVVLAMREDYVARLSTYADLLPGELRHRYYMQRLREQAALEAITQPVAADKFKRPFEAGVAESLVENLRLIHTEDNEQSRWGEFVEPVQLQVVCFQLWERLRNRKGETITKEDLEALAGSRNLSQFVNQALIGFYETALRNVLAHPDIEAFTAASPDQAVTEYHLRVWFGSQLITASHTRGFVHRGTETTGNLPNIAVDLLQEQFIIRSDSRAGGVWYELVHDRFVTPILTSNRRWRLLQARNNPVLRATERSAEAWRDQNRDPHLLYSGQQLSQAEQEIDLDTAESLVKEFIGQSRKRQDKQDADRLRKQRIGLVAIALITLVLAGWALFSSFEAAKERDRAITLQEAAETAEAEADNERDIAKTAEAISGVEEEKAISAQATAVVDRRSALENHATAVAAQAIAENNERLAEEQAEDAITERIRSNAREVIASALGYLDSEPSRALLLSVEAAKRFTTTVETSSGLLASLLHEADLVSVPVSYVYDYSVSLIPDGPIYRLASNSAGSRIAAGGPKGQIYLLGGAAASEISQLSAAHGEFPILGLAVSEDGRALFSASGAEEEDDAASDDHRLLRWDLTASPPVVADRLDLIEPVRDLALRSDGDWLAIANDDGEVVLLPAKLRDAAGNEQFDSDFGKVLSSSPEKAAIEELLTSDSAGGRVNSVAFSPNGEHLAAGNENGSVVLWDASEIPVKEPSGVTLTDRLGPVNDVNFSSDSRLLASAGGDGSVRLFDLTRDPPSLRTYPLDRGAVQTVVFGADDGLLAAGLADGGIYLIGIRNNARKYVRHNGPENPDDGLSINDLVYDPGHLRLISVADGGSAGVWQSQATHTLGKSVLFPRSTSEPIFLNEAHSGYLQVGDDQILIHDQTSQEPRRIALPDTMLDWGSISAAMAGNMLAASDRESIWLWNLDNTDQAPQQLVTGNAGPILSGTLAFNIDGTVLAVAGCSDAADQTQDIQTASGPCSPINVYVWDNIGGASFSPGPTLTDLTSLSALLFRPMSQELVLGTSSGEIRFWNYDLAKERSSLHEHVVPIIDIAFNTNGTLMASIDDDGEIFLWDLRSEAPDPAPLPEYGGHHRSVLFNPGGEFLISAGCDGLCLQDRLQFWNADLERPLESLSTSLPGKVKDLVIDQTQKMQLLLEDNHLIEWDLADGALTTKICEVAGRNLTFEEWKTAFPDLPESEYIDGLTCPVPSDVSFVYAKLDEARSRLRRCYLSNEDMAEATEILQAARDLDLRDGTVDVNFDPDQETITVLKAQIQQFLDDGIKYNDRARDCLVQLDRLLPAEIDPDQTLRIETHLGSAEAFIAQADYEAALEGLEELASTELTDGQLFRHKQRIVRAYDTLCRDGDLEGACTRLPEFVEPVFAHSPVQSNLADVSLWQFAGEAGQFATISLAGSEDGSLDPYLTLLDARLNSLREDDNSGYGSIGLDALIRAFPLPDDGIYYVRPAGNDSLATYELTFAAQTPERLEFDEPVTSTVEDQSLWQFEGEAGQIVSIELAPEDEAFWPRLTLLRSDGSTLAEADAVEAGLKATISSVILPDSGAYLIEAGGSGGSGQFELTLNQISPEDIDVVTFEAPVQSSTSETSLWQFEGEAGQFVTIALVDTEQGDFDPYLTLLDSEFTSIREDDDSGGGLDGFDALIQAFVLPDDGPYYIQTGRSGSSAVYELTLVSEVPEPIQFNEPVISTVEDQSLWQFEGEAGQIVTISLVDTEDGDFDPYLTLLDGNLTSIWEDDDSGGGADGYDALIQAYVLPDDGPYYIQTGRSGSSAVYELTLVSEVPEPIQFDEPVISTLEDQSLWQFEGEAGQIVNIDLEPQDEDFISRLALVQTGGSKLIEVDGSGQGLKTTINSYILPESGTYLIETGGSSGSGQFTLTLSEAVPEPISFGAPVQSSTAETSLWQFEGEAGQLVTISLVDSEDGSFDPYLTLLDASLTSIREDDDSGGGLDGYDALIQAYILPDDGSYYIQTGRSGSSALYELTLISEVPEPIQFDEPITSTVEDQSLWQFEGEAGQIVSISLEPQDEDYSPYLTLLLSNGWTLTEADAGAPGLTATINGYILPESGTYLIQSRGSGGAGQFELTLSEVAPEDIASVAFGDPVQSSTAETSLWRFEGEAGQFVTISLVDTEDGAFDPYLTLLDANLISIREDDDSGAGLDDYDALIQAFVLPDDGAYYIQAGRSGSSAVYELTLTADVPELIQFDEPVTSTVEDQSLWQFEGEAGQIVSINLESQDIDFSPYLALLRSDGSSLTEVDGGVAGLDASIPAFVLPVDGLFLIEVRGSGGTGQFSLTLEEVPPETIETITFDQPEQSTIRENPLWQFEGEAGQALQIRLDTAAFDPRLRLKFASGPVIAEAVDLGDGFGLSLQTILPADDLYFIEVDSDDRQETYTLSIDMLDASELSAEMLFEILGEQVSAGQDQAAEATVLTMLDLVQAESSTAETNVEMWFILCLLGSVYGHSELVIDGVCVDALAGAEAGEEAEIVRLGLGMARALTGDVANAIDDLNVFLDAMRQSGGPTEAAIITMFEAAVKQLEAGEEPAVVFDDAFMDRFKQELR